MPECFEITEDKKNKIKQVEKGTQISIAFIKAMANAVSALMIIYLLNGSASSESDRCDDAPESMSYLPWTLVLLFGTLFLSLFKYEQTQLELKETTTEHDSITSKSLLRKIITGASAVAFCFTDAGLNAFPLSELTDKPAFNTSVTIAAFLVLLLQNGRFTFETAREKETILSNSYFGAVVDCFGVAFRVASAKKSLVDIVSDDNSLKWLAWVIAFEPSVFVTKYFNYRTSVHKSNPELEPSSNCKRAIVATSLYPTFAYASQDSALYTRTLMESPQFYQLFKCYGHVPETALWGLIGVLEMLSYGKKYHTATDYLARKARFFQCGRGEMEDVEDNQIQDGDDERKKLLSRK